jgi:hypothetical protein
VFVPLSAIRRAAEVQVAAARRFADAGYSVLVKKHPMYPLPVQETENLKVTDTPLAGMTSVRLVVFTSGASGLDAVLAGLPAVRLQTSEFISINVLPAFVSVAPATLETLETAISAPPPPPDVPWDTILSEPDIDGWQALLRDDRKQQPTSNGAPHAVP